METMILRLAPEQAEHEHAEVRPYDLKCSLFECVDCGAVLCMPELEEAMRLSVATE